MTERLSKDVTNPKKLYVGDGEFNPYLCTRMVNCTDVINVKLELLNNFYDIVLDYT